jgi:uncharacterized protein (DUF1330 family)
MPKGYWIPHLDVSNMQGFQAYRDMADAAHKRFGSRLLARGGRRELVEGQVRARNVLREFNSFDEAETFYHGPEYSAAHPLREPHSECDFLIVEGYDGPQPPPIGPPPAAAPLKGYWLVHLDVADPEGYKPYQAAVVAPFGKFGGRYLVRGGRCEMTEGRVRSRTVVLEFPSYEAALACYRSPEYQAAKALRQGKADADIVVVEGYDGK